MPANRASVGLCLLVVVAGACKGDDAGRDGGVRDLLAASDKALSDQALSDQRLPDQRPPDKAPSPRVLLSTSMGDITLELNQALAPITVKNFLDYVDASFYDGTIFHRVIANFMIQGGGYDGSYQRKSTRPAIQNEAKNGLSNDRGTIAMARTSAVNSATAQFYVNVVDNPGLNYKDDQNYGYAVFGKVVQGMDVVDQIKDVPTGAVGPFGSDCPLTNVVINSATRAN
jgi:peptidyl-prolyl cis-trans isomerase A (cyclophilin A)